LFIDEFQSIFGSRQPGGATSGLASLLLQLMDAASRAQAPNALLEKDHNNESANNSANHGSSGGGGGRGGRVVVVAATNSPEAIDSAFLRPGRFDHLVRGVVLFYVVRHIHTRTSKMASFSSTSFVYALIRDSGNNRPIFP
jgi:SpoVK/Ycf46/Vps4 family AAA+-type ATPase